MIIKNAVLFDRDFNQTKADIRIENAKIVSIGDFSREDGLDAAGCTLAPGFIDTHIHGCNGGDFCEGYESMEKMSAWLITQGITSFCGTTMTLSNALLSPVMQDARRFAGNEPGAKLAGIHLEGPYINIVKKGAQNPIYIRPGSVDEFRQLNAASGGLTKIITVAPEAFDSAEFIHAVSKDAMVSIGHSNATAEETKQAFAAGVNRVTHLFNAMTAFTHREPGIVGAAFDTGSAFCELVCDGHHVDPLMIRVAFRQLGEDRIAVISDSMKAAGYVDGKYELGGQDVFVKDNLARLADGTIAASVSNLYEEFKNLLSFGIPVRSAMKACTINPAKSANLADSIGSLDIGKDADLVVFDSQWNIRNVMLKGVFTKPWQN